MLPVQDGALLQRYMPGIVCPCLCESVCCMCCLTLFAEMAFLLQRQAWSVHRRECKCLRSLLPRIPTDSVRLSARILFALVRHTLTNTQGGVSIKRQIYVYCTHCFAFWLLFVLKNSSSFVFVSYKHPFCFLPQKEKKNLQGFFFVVILIKSV